MYQGHKSMSERIGYRLVDSVTRAEITATLVEVVKYGDGEQRYPRRPETLPEFETVADECVRSGRAVKIVRDDGTVAREFFAR